MLGDRKLCMGVHHRKQTRQDGPSGARMCIPYQDATRNDGFRRRVEEYTEAPKGVAEGGKLAGTFDIRGSLKILRDQVRALASGIRERKSHQVAARQRTAIISDSKSFIVHGDHDIEFTIPRTFRGWRGKRNRRRGGREPLKGKQRGVRSAPLLISRSRHRQGEITRIGGVATALDQRGLVRYRPRGFIKSWC
jgi:hypothetical protein